MIPKWRYWTMWLVSVLALSSYSYLSRIDSLWKYAVLFVLGAAWELLLGKYRESSRKEDR